jgi:hypothetical protein
MDTKIGLLETATTDAERIDGGPERSVLVFSLYPSLAGITSERWISRDLAATSPYALIGDVDAIVDKIQERRERWGLSYYVCWDVDVEEFIPVVRKLAQ